MALAPGTLIGQKVRLLREIARGGMGSVWLAEHLTLRSDVAGKFMAPELADHREAIARFTREATVAAQIKSQHVIQIFDQGRTEVGQPYIVMELLDGEDLGRRIERVRALAPADVILIVRQVCKALNRAHARGIVHRDIKPENIFLVDAEGDLFVKLLDFGVAKRNETPLRSTGSGVTVGTPFYMSPEQVLSARDVDYRTDLWSVAVVAYHALTGQVPFMAETVGAICVAIDKAIFIPPSEARPELPPTLDAWFSRAFARDPAFRFTSAKELAATFERAALGLAESFDAVLAPMLEDSIPPPSFAPSASVHDTPLDATITQPRSRTRKVWLALGGLTLALLGAAVTAAVMLLTRPPPPVKAPATALVYLPPGATSAFSISAAAAETRPVGVVVEPQLPAPETASAEPQAKPKPAASPAPARRTTPRFVRRAAYPSPRSTTTAPAPAPPVKDRGF
jgi:serine/threonine-protein kinase